MRQENRKLVSLFTNNIANNSTYLHLRPQLDHSSTLNFFAFAPDRRWWLIIEHEPMFHARIRQGAYFLSEFPEPARAKSSI